MNIELNPEKIIEQAAARLADEAYENVNAMEMLEAEISNRIDKFLKDRATTLMEDTLRRAMDEIMTREILPVNQWGERTGAKTTLRDEMQRRAQEFWEVKVDEKGNPTTYGGKPRHQRMYENIASDVFAKSIQDNIEDVIAGFRDALRLDAAKMLGEHIERFIKAPKRK